MANVNSELFMDRKSLIINNENIICYDINTSNQAVIFIHGNSSSSKAFSNQLNEDRLKKYRLITFDFPGHGDSQYSSDPDQSNSISGYISFIQEIIQHFKLEKYVLAAHSMGGDIALQSISKLPGVIGLVIFGTGPVKNPLNFEEIAYPSPVLQYIFKPVLIEDEAMTWAKNSVLYDENLVQLIYDDIKKTDPNARVVLGKSILSGQYLNEVEVLEKLDKPVAIFHGEKEPFIKLSYLQSLKIRNLWQSKVHVIEDSCHFPQLENPKSFNHFLLKFLEDIFPV